jgi:small subunit ribosomal protein S2
MDSKTLKITDFIDSYGYLGITHWRTWKPAIFPYIFEKATTSVKFDLIKTQIAFENAFRGLKTLLPYKDTHIRNSDDCHKILLIGTNLESKKIVRDIASCFNNVFNSIDGHLPVNIFYVTHKWKGGTMSNWQETKKRIERLKEGIVLYENPYRNLKKLEKETKTKKYLKALRKHEELKEQTMGLLSNPYYRASLQRLDGRPELVIFTDPAYDSHALKECHDLGLKIIALVNTDCNLEMIDYPIPINTHCEKSIAFILDALFSRYIRELYPDCYPHLNLFLYNLPE